MNKSQSYKRYWARKTSGVCVKCGKCKAAPESFRCEGCIEDDKIRGREYYHKLISERKCISCREPLSAFEIRHICFACRIKASARRQEKHD